jgi:hypothetical protein
MIIDLSKSHIFTIEPAARFAREFDTTHDMWNELWKRYKLYDYTVEELCDYCHIKLKRRPSNKSIKRWIIRTEIYSKANDARKRGAFIVKSEFFGDLEGAVIKEVTHGLKYGKAVSARPLI